MNSKYIKIIGLGILIWITLSIVAFQGVTAANVVIYQDKYLDEFYFNDTYIFSLDEPCTAYTSQNPDLFWQLLDNKITPGVFISQGGTYYEFPDPIMDHALYFGENITFFMIKDSGSIITTGLKYNLTEQYNLKDYFYYQGLEQAVTLVDDNSVIPFQFKLINSSAFWTIVGGELSSCYFYGVLLFDEHEFLLHALIRPMSAREIYDASNAGIDIRLDIPVKSVEYLNKGYHKFLTYLLFSSPEKGGFIFFDEEDGITIRFTLPYNQFGLIILGVGCLCIAGCCFYVRRMSFKLMKKSQANIAHHYIQLSKKNQEVKKKKENINLD